MSISDRIIKGGRTIQGDLIDNGHPKLRATVRRDSYDDQSYGKVEVWTDVGWQLIHSVPISELAIAEYTPSYSQQTREQYQHSRNGMEGLPFWYEVVSADLDDLIAYGRRFFQ